MKKTIKLFGLILCLLGFASIFVSMFSVIPREETPSKYTITYRAVHNGLIEPINEDMWKENGNYPTYYIQGEETEIDDLDSFVPISATHDLDFGGWYWDVKFENEFNGFTDETSGNVTLYAKVTDGYWTANY